MTTDEFLNSLTAEEREWFEQPRSASAEYMRWRVTEARRLHVVAKVTGDPADMDAFWRHCFLHGIGGG